MDYLAPLRFAKHVVWFKPTRDLEIVTTLIFIDIIIDP